MFGPADNPTEKPMASSLKCMVARKLSKNGFLISIGKILVFFPHKMENYKI
jgi:hypothetical protein